MKYIVSSHAKTDFLLIKTSGNVDNYDDDKHLANEVYEETMKHDFRKVLLDHRETDFTSSVTNQTQLIKYYSEELHFDIRLFRVAVVANEKSKETADFWEVYANNRGFNYKVFYAMEPAFEFLEK